MVKNPKETNQLGIYKRGQEAELGTTKKYTSYWSERDLNP